MRSVILVTALLVTPALSQRLTIGAVAGTGVTGDFHTGSATFPALTLADGTTPSSTTFVASSVSRSLIIGPKLELSLGGRWSLEVDALHRPLRSTVTQFFSPPIVLPNGMVFTKFGPNTAAEASWEIPVLGRYRLRVAGWNPFVEAGPSFRPAGNGTNLTHFGATAGAGVEFHAHSVNIAPTIRYTHWQEFPDTGPVGSAIANQVEFLVGVEPELRGSGWANVFGRTFSIGALAGVGLGDDVRPAQASPSFFFRETSESNRPIVGIMLELNLYRSLFVEADGIYRALHATDSSSAGSVRFAVLTWEFPVLPKYKFRASRRVRPFGELGPSFRLDGNFNGPTPSHYGGTAGTGVEVGFGKLKISPAVRYTRWGNERAATNRFRPSTFLNEVECLAGFSF